MTSYRVSRRAFLGGIGAAFGLQSLLANLEASAEGISAPPRLLILHWPVGTLRQRFLPEGSGREFVPSPILQPFEAAGLRESMIGLYGLKQGPANYGGGHEAGMVVGMTGVTSPGTRAGGLEQDDSCAGGPSFDQIFLRNVPLLQRPGPGYANAIGDARVDAGEVSARCMSYGYTKQAVESAHPDGVLDEHIPLLPMLQPAMLYAQLFTGFMPGGASDANVAAARRALRLRKSVLDSSLNELARIRALAPADQREKIDVHAEIVRKVESSLATEIDGMPPMGCAMSAAPDPEIQGKSGNRRVNNPLTESADSDHLEQVVKLHAGVIRAAFQCDIIRVATLQWASAMNQVAFKGMYPGENPEIGRMHHPTSHQIASEIVTNGPPPSDPESGQGKAYEFLSRVQTWFNQKTADILLEFNDAIDVYGERLLDRTVVPFVTDVGEATHSRNAMPALIFGGRKLGLKGGQFQRVERPYNDFWLSISQAFFPDAGDAIEPLQNEGFTQDPAQITGVIPGLWAPPT